jgi:hypothetical protein
MATKFGPQVVPANATHYRPAHAYYGKGTVHAYAFRPSGQPATAVPLCGANSKNSEVAAPHYTCQPPTCATCARLVADHQLQPLHWCPSCEGHKSVRPTEPNQQWAYCEACGRTGLDATAACGRTGLDATAPEASYNLRSDCGRVVFVAQERAFPFARHGHPGQRAQWAALSLSAKAPYLRWARLTLRLPHVALPITCWPYDS